MGKISLAIRINKRLQFSKLSFVFNFGQIDVTGSFRSEKNLTSSESELQT